MGLFQRNANEGGRLSAPPGEPRATLAVFGKHPGWDDHLPGLGIETEVLARLKQVFYVTGIGGQIDSGAWEKLEAGKRLEGFEHTFLGFIGGHVVVGQLWSSTDRKGRAKYPMVVCADCEGMMPEAVLVKMRPELDRLRTACKAVTSAEQVTAEWSAARQRLRLLVGPPAATSTDPAPGVESRRRFLECGELGPGKVGLLRILHELAGALGNSGSGHTPRHGAVVDLHPHHLRVPLCSESRNEALLLWTGFLDCALPAGAPLMLIARSGVDWVDVVIGEPGSEDLFCLQASPNALPLATAIPYELSPDLEPRLQVMEGKFLLTDAAAGPAPKSAPKSPPPSPPAARAPSASKPAPPAKPPGSGGSKGWIFLVCGVLLLGESAAVWYFIAGHPSDAGTLAVAKPPPATGPGGRRLHHPRCQTQLRWLLRNHLPTRRRQRLTGMLRP